MIAEHSESFGAFPKFQEMAQSDYELQLTPSLLKRHHNLVKLVKAFKCSHMGGRCELWVFEVSSFLHFKIKYSDEIIVTRTKRGLLYSTHLSQEFTYSLFCLYIYDDAQMHEVMEISCTHYLELRRIRDFDYNKTERLPRSFSIICI